MARIDIHRHEFIARESTEEALLELANPVREESGFWTADTRGRRWVSYDDLEEEEPACDCALCNRRTYELEMAYDQLDDQVRIEQGLEPLSWRDDEYEDDYSDRHEDLLFFDQEWTWRNPERAKTVQSSILWARHEAVERARVRTFDFVDFLEAA